MGFKLSKIHSISSSVSISMIFLFVLGRLSLSRRWHSVISSSYSQLKKALSARTRLLTVWLEAAPFWPGLPLRWRMKSCVFSLPISSRQVDMSSYASQA